MSWRGKGRAGGGREVCVWAGSAEVWARGEGGVQKGVDGEAFGG